MITELNYPPFHSETQVQDDTHAAWCFAFSPRSHLAPAHTMCSGSSVIFLVQKSAFPKMIPHGQFLSSFQNCLCGLTSCQSEKESVFVGMFSSWRLESLPLGSVRLSQEDLYALTH